MYYVYILKGKRYYCGSTNNLKRRVQEHKRGKTITSRVLHTYTLVGYYLVETKEKALALERKIKDSGHIERWTHKDDFVVI
ncbi:MAG TPA: GIY-YIG nuclease family protein [Candidatus Absconditabacterales bacterium]|nr:GIY-YIG nuclease family protein [Candidatus Absconditabacterales bacterium]